MVNIQNSFGSTESIQRGRATIEIPPEHRQTSTSTSQNDGFSDPLDSDSEITIQDLNSPQINASSNSSTIPFSSQDSNPDRKPETRALNAPELDSIFKTFK